jgi:hypothetical protein
MAKRDKAPGRTGPVCRMPWHDGAFPADWNRGKRGGRRVGRSPRPGARTGPVRSGRR